MLMSNYRHNIDGKNRLFMPSKFREELGAKFVVAQSIRDRSLKVYSLAEWDRYVAPIKQLPRKDSEAILRTLAGNSIEVSPDSQGRIILTPAMIEFANITKETVIIGCDVYAEIWAAEEYADYLANKDDSVTIKALEAYGL